MTQIFEKRPKQDKSNLFQQHTTTTLFPKKQQRQSDKLAEQTFSNDIDQKQNLMTPSRAQDNQQQLPHSPLFPFQKSSDTFKSKTNSPNNLFVTQSSQYNTNRVNNTGDTLFSPRNNQASTNINNSSAMESGQYGSKLNKVSIQQEVPQTLMGLIDSNLISLEQTVQIRMLVLSNVQNFPNPSLGHQIPSYNSIFANISVGGCEQFVINKVSFLKSFSLPIHVILRRNKEININLITQVGGDQRPNKRIGSVRIQTDLILDGLISEGPLHEEFSVRQKVDDYEEPMSPTSQIMKLKIQIKYPPLDKMQPIKRNEAQQNRSVTQPDLKQMIEQSVQQNLSVTPHKFSNPFQPVPVASSPNLYDDPILLVDPDDAQNKCMTQQLTDQLFEFEKQIEIPQLFMQNLQKEFDDIMKIYDENHSNLQSFKSKFQGKYLSIHSDFEQLQNDLMSIKGQVLKLNDRNQVSIVELQRVRTDLKLISQQLEAYDDKYQVDVSEAQSKVQSLQQDLMKIELEKLEKQLEVTQQKSRAFIQSSEILQIQREKKIKLEYEEKIQTLLQSKQLDYGDKQLLQRQNEAMNMAIKKKEEELEVLLNDQKDKSAELFKRIQELQGELDKKNKQIEDEMQVKMNLMQLQEEKEVKIKSKFAEDMERRQKQLEQELSQKYSSQQMNQKQREEFLQEIKNLREESQLKTIEIQRMKKQQENRQRQGRQLTPSGKDKAIQKQLEEKIFLLQQERDSLVNEVKKHKKQINEYKSGSRTPQTPNLELQNYQTTPMSMPISSPTSPTNRHFVFDNRSSPARSRNLDSLPVFGGTNHKQSPNSRIARKIRQTIEDNQYEIKFEKAQQKDMYYFGNKKIKSMISHDGTILVRVGGGFVTIEEFLKKYNNKVREAQDPEMSLVDFFPQEQYHNTPLSKFTQSQQPSASQTFGKQETAQMNPFQLSAIKNLDDQFNNSFKKQSSICQLNQQKAINQSSTSSTRNSRIPVRPSSTKNKDSSNHFKELTQHSGFVVNGHKSGKQRSQSKSSLPKVTSSPNLLNRSKHSKIPSGSSKGRKKSEEKSFKI